ncbi:phosphorylated adapter RNA export protein isoform X1 [Sminthopsis crassicaudata]|uniref:phosphorylated adapter RNA export protein isoform X1 n=1 Tax=Sminthopsis crassicaudata TaxID=9301 RepID=UPI003D694E58
MALEVRGMEDGELSDSDSDMTDTVTNSDKPLQPPQLVRNEREGKVPDGNISFRPFQSSIAVSTVSHYRTIKGVESSEESFSDSDDDNCLWKRKRQKCFNALPKPEPFQFVQNHQKQHILGGRKINNIWGAVLQEQSQDAVANELGILGMEGTIDKSRQSETYNYLLAKKLMRESQTGKLDKELDEYMHDDKKAGPKEEENGHGHMKRKRPIKDRLGNRVEMNYKGRYEITEEDTEEKVADEISFRLQEPKKDLITRVVKIIGNKKAIELLMETAEVEQNGGLLIMNGSRRRTPGGVYLNLLKNTPSITEEQIKEIFFVENQKEYENKKAAKKRRIQVLGKKMKQAIKGLNLQEYDDASRETFASDTNEALASLDDSQEGQGERS